MASVPDEANLSKYIYFITIPSDQKDTKVEQDSNQP